MLSRRGNVPINSIRTIDGELRLPISSDGNVTLPIALPLQPETQKTMSLEEFKKAMDALFNAKKTLRLAIDYVTVSVKQVNRTKRCEWKSLEEGLLSCRVER